MKTGNKCRRLFSLLVVLMLVLSLAGCGKKDSGAESSSAEVTSGSDTQSSSETENSADTEGSQDAEESLEAEGSDEASEAEAPAEAVKSDGYEKFSQLKIGMTESEVNAILGEPASVNKANYYYNITVNGKDMELSVWINTTTGLVTYISGNFYSGDYRAEFADSETDLSGAGGLETGDINTYDDCVSAFKTPGYLTCIDEDGETEYFWVNSAEGYVTVTFRADGTIKKYSGYC